MVPGLTLALSIAGGIGCAGSESGDNPPGTGADQAYLTIVGDSDLFAEAGDRRTLVVRYHDQNDRPLAGEVSFRFEGDPAGAQLSTTALATDAEGEVAVDLDFGKEGEAAFQVYADAANAESVFWRASVTEPPLGVAGRYALESQFDLGDGLPEGEADELRVFLELTDDPHDPATWVLDYVKDWIDEEGGSELATAFEVARQSFGLDKELYDFLMANSPAFVEDLVATGDGLADVSEDLGLVSRLEIASDDIESGALSAHHRVTGAVFELDGTRHEYAAQKMGLVWDKVGPLAASAHEQRKELSISEHQVYLPYGMLLVFALDNVVAPSIDPLSGSFAQLLANRLDCEGIGAWLAEEIGAGSATTYETACIAGLGAAVGYVTGEIETIEADLVLSGDADLVDGNRDFEVEALENGEWEGELVFGAGAVALDRPDQRFAGSRMNNVP